MRRNALSLIVIIAVSVLSSESLRAEDVAVFVRTRDLTQLSKCKDTKCIDAALAGFTVPNAATRLAAAVWRAKLKTGEASDALLWAARPDTDVEFAAVYALTSPQSKAEWRQLPYDYIKLLAAATERQPSRLVEFLRLFYVVDGEVAAFYEEVADELPQSVLKSADKACSQLPKQRRPSVCEGRTSQVKQ